MALSRRAARWQLRQLLGVKRTRLLPHRAAVYDPLLPCAAQNSPITATVHLTRSRKQTISALSPQFRE